MERKYFSIKTGDLRLQVNRRENIFHAEDIPLLEILPSYEDLIGITKIGFGSGLPTIDFKKIEKLKLDLKREDTVINGYYADTLFTEFTNNYKVNIYISYQVEE